MKLHLHLPQSLLFGTATSKLGFMSNAVAPNAIKKNTVGKKNTKFNKLLPQHWFDGVWDDLNFKM